MKSKFSLRDVVVAIGSTKPIWTIVKIVEKNTTDYKVVSRPYYVCNSLDEGIHHFEEDEIEFHK